MGTKLVVVDCSSSVAVPILAVRVGATCATSAIASIKPSVRRGVTTATGSKIGVPCS